MASKALISQCNTHRHHSIERVKGQWYFILRCRLKKYLNISTQVVGYLYKHGHTYKCGQWTHGMSDYCFVSMYDLGNEGLSTTCIVRDSTSVCTRLIRNNGMRYRRYR